MMGGGSIATLMGKTTATPESKALAAAFKGRPRGFVSSVARQIGVEPNNISHWIHGRRPVPAVYARPLATMLGVDPASISTAFAAVAAGENVSQMPVKAELAPGLVASRQDNDVDALRFIVSAQIVAMLTHRPAEATEFARLLRTYAPAKFHTRGFLGEILAMAESRAAPKAAAPGASQPRAKR